MIKPQHRDLLAVPSGSLQIQEQASTPIINRKHHSRLCTSSPIYLSLVIPTYNEGENTRIIIGLLAQILDKIIPNQYELIVVDDDSPDLTWKIALDLLQEYPQLQVMRRIKERGLSSAVIRGWQVSQGEILGVIDADLQHPPEVLQGLLTSMKEGADLAVASRHIAGGGVSEWSIVRRFLSRGAQVLGLIVLPQVVGRVSDPMSGYFLVRRSKVTGAALHPMGYKILLEVLGRGSIDNIAEVGYVFQERLEGESKVTSKQYIDYLLHLARLRSQGRAGGLRQRFPIGKFIRFGLVGLSGVFVDMLVFYLLSDPSTLAWGLTRSKIIAAEVAIINNFLWNDRWTFGDVNGYQPGWSQRSKRLMKFNLICLGGVLLNLLLLNLLFNYVGINRYIANLISIAAVTIWNFWLNLKLSWRVTEVKK